MAGSVAWEGRDLAAADPQSVWARMGRVPQDYARWRLSAREFWLSPG